MRIEVVQNRTTLEVISYHVDGREVNMKKYKNIINALDGCYFSSNSIDSIDNDTLKQVMEFDCRFDK